MHAGTFICSFHDCPVNILSTAQHIVGTQCIFAELKQYIPTGQPYEADL